MKVDEFYHPSGKIPGSDAKKSDITDSFSRGEKPHRGDLPPLATLPKSRSRDTTNPSPYLGL